MRLPLQTYLYSVTAAAVVQSRQHERCSVNYFPSFNVRQKVSCSFVSPSHQILATPTPLLQWCNYGRFRWFNKPAPPTFRDLKPQDPSDTKEIIASRTKLSERKNVLIALVPWKHFDVNFESCPCDIGFPQLSQQDYWAMMSAGLQGVSELGPRSYPLKLGSSKHRYTTACFAFFPLNLFDHRSFKSEKVVFMAALRSRCGHYILVLFLSSFFFFYSPNLSGRRLDVYHASTHGVAIVRI